MADPYQMTNISALQTIPKIEKKEMLPNAFKWSQYYPGTKIIWRQTQKNIADWSPWRTYIKKILNKIVENRIQDH